MSGGGQSLKAAITSRVDQATAIRNYSNNYNIGYPENCPDKTGNLFFDQYGRMVPHTTLKTDQATDGCSNNQFYTAQRRIAVENIERPYVDVAQAGSRWGGDFQGQARNRQAYNLYEQGRGSGFVRNYKTPNDAPPDPSGGCGSAPVYLNHGYPRNFAHTMDAQSNRVQI
jgi:hypothetical protein